VVVVAVAVDVARGSETSLNSGPDVVPIGVTLCDRVLGTGPVLMFATVRLFSEDEVMYCNI